MFDVVEQQKCGMSVAEALTAVEKDLCLSGAESPRMAAEWVLADLLSVRRLELSLYRDTPLTEMQASRLTTIRDRLRAQEPIQYILGETDFMGLGIHCDPRALIPRPETECLVELALQDPVWSRSGVVRVIDVGTGSGCVALAIASQREQANVLAIDVSEEALALAQENVGRLKMEKQIQLCRGNLLEGQAADSADLVVANLPYIDRDECNRLPPEVRLHEPVSALDGGEHGIELMARLIEQAWTVLRSGGALYLEMGADQGAWVRDLLEAQGYQQVAVVPDLTGRDRIAKGVVR